MMEEIQGEAESEIREDVQVEAVAEQDIQAVELADLRGEVQRTTTTYEYLMYAIDSSEDDDTIDSAQREDTAEVLMPRVAEATPADAIDKAQPCVICREELFDKPISVVLPCAHCYHSDCAQILIINDFPCSWCNQAFDRAVALKL